MAEHGADRPQDWFPPERGPVLVIGNPGNIFPRHLAALWRSMGLDARILTRRWNGPDHTNDGTPILSADHREPVVRRLGYSVIERVSQAVEALFITAQRRRYREAMGAETTYRPRLSPWVADALSIAHAARAMSPQFVCGQEVFAYGLATAWSPSVTALMPWGGDVNMYCNTTTVAFEAVRYALTHVDLVVPGSPLTRDDLNSRFGVPLERMHCSGLWRLDRERFKRAGPQRRAALCADLKIDPQALLVMNVRRFFPAWGSDIAVDAMLAFAKQHQASHFILLGGFGTESFVAAARSKVAHAGLGHRFTFFDGDLPLERCAELMSVTDVFLSLMREHDMRPFASILEASACGGAPVIGDQPEYRTMEQLGFRAAFCPVSDVEAIVAALANYAMTSELRRATGEANTRYIDEHENGEEQALSLLRRIRSIPSRR